ncbi:MAG TPA: VWA domain-containing protein [Pirellulales bacterium]|jgi:hypothetical protein|nr:VWA domain-containing protein [Pirellulales bacterium]
MGSNHAVTIDDASTPIRAPGAIPWLLSASAHCLLLIILTVGFVLSQGPPPPVGSPGGVSLDASIVSGDGQGPYSDEPTGDPEGGQTAGGSGGPGSGSGATTDAVEPAIGAGGVGGSPLSDVLQSAPPMFFAGSLPAVTPGLGAGTLEGGGLGSAQGTTKGSSGSKNLRGSGYARTGVFGIESEGYKFVYVFDRSGSMGGHGGAPLAAAKKQLIDSLEHLGQTHQFQIIFYNDDPHVFNLTGSPSRLVFANDQNKTLAERFIGSITADGGTAHEEALTKALRMGPDVIFFLTDADEPRLGATELQRIARANKGAIINTIEFGYGPAFESDNFLIRLARQNRGKHAYVDISQLPRPAE